MRLSAVFCRPGSQQCTASAQSWITPPVHPLRTHPVPVVRQAPLLSVSPPINLHEAVPALQILYNHCSRVMTSIIARYRPTSCLFDVCTVGLGSRHSIYIYALCYAIVDVAIYTRFVCLIGVLGLYLTVSPASSVPATESRDIVRYSRN